MGASHPAPMDRPRATALLRLTVTAVAATTLAATLAACGGSHAVTSSSPEPLRIGVIYSLSGSQASLDIPSLDGARLAVDRLNASGGLLGRRVELLERDAQSSSTVARSAAESLVAAGAIAIVGLSDTDLAQAAAPVAARAGIPFITSGATSPLLPEEVPDWLFLACFGDNTQAAAGAEYAVSDLHADTVTILYDKDKDYTRLLEQYFSSSFRAQGGRVLAEIPFTGDDHDAFAEFNRRKTAATSADLLYVAVGPDAAAPLVRRLRAAGYRQPIMGGDSYDSDELRHVAEGCGGNVYYTTHSPLGLQDITVALHRFSTRYEAAYGREPESSFACLGYDAVQLLAHAVVAGESALPVKIRDALRATRHFTGSTGILSYTDDERVPRKQVTVVHVGSRASLAALFTPSFVPEP